MTAKTETTGTNLEDNAPDGISLTDAEAKAARKEGAKEAAKEAGAATYKALTDGNLPGAPPVDQYLGSDESQQYAWLIEQGISEFEKSVSKSTKDSHVTDTMAAGLLKLERAGQNRTPYVKALLTRLGIKGDEIGKVTTAGPSYTNDMSNITDL